MRRNATMIITSSLTQNEQESDKFLLEILKLDPEFKSNVLENYPALKERLKALAP